MGNPSTIFMLFSMVLALVGSYPAGASTLSEMTHSLDQWFKNLSQEKATLTKLQIYILANFASENQTVYQVATAEITSKSPTNFGRILVIDNWLTAGPDPELQFLGRYQGMIAYSDFNETSTNMDMNIIFSGGEYDGSTISILGRQPSFEEVRVLPVVGGTGVFRLAKGIVLASTLSNDPVAKTGVYVYVMYVVTPAVGSVRTA